MIATAARVCVNDAGTGLGARVARRLGSDDSIDLVSPADCETLVWLTPIELDAAQRRAGGDVSDALAASPGLTHVVLVSSAMVYGAWANNPVPLTEDAVLRPPAEFDLAQQLATAEARVDEWRRAVPGRTSTVLRPVVSVAADGTSSLARALAAGLGQRASEDDPPAQFLHLDDLCSAVVLAAQRRLDGVFNVAPDGWVSGERVRALSGAVPRLKLPARLAEVVGNLRWRFQRGPIPPGLRSYTRWPWLVANDRLKAAGWQPTVTNEQAYVEGTEAKWWTMVTPKRRQEIALGALGVLIAVAAVLVVKLVRRVRARALAP